MIATIREQGEINAGVRAADSGCENPGCGRKIYIGLTAPSARTRATIAGGKGAGASGGNYSCPRLRMGRLSSRLRLLLTRKGVETVKDAINGALDIIAEGISDDAKHRTYIRDITVQECGLIQSEAKDETAQTVYEILPL